MTYYDNGFARLYQADARHLPIPDSSVDCVVTSPPYWGLRDYGLEEQGIGLEPTPEEYCANMVEVFREVWRVLKPTGTVWLNLGDSYSGGGGAHKPEHANPGLSKSAERNGVPTSERDVISGLKPKDLVGIPWRVAFALQADGWYLRSDIIWSKPNPMPESVTDRPTKSHEYVFLLTKSPRYYYDADAIREANKPESEERYKYSLDGSYTPGWAYPNEQRDKPQQWQLNPAGRNKRSVWEITTHPYPEAHFATYPEKLVEPCILAGTSEKGNCAQCGKPWERVVGHDCESCGALIPVQAKACPKCGYTRDWKQGRTESIDMMATDWSTPGRGTPRLPGNYQVFNRSSDDWQPTCGCNADTVPATVLDPFAGSGTTLAVAQRLGRKSIGADLNEEYLKLASKRLRSISMPMILA
jgi:DNA modification methylase